MQLLTNIAAVVGLISTFIGVVTLCSKHVRKFWHWLISNMNKDLKEENQVQNKNIEEIKDNILTLLTKVNVLEDEAMQNCREVIKNIYYRYCKEKKIPLYERKTADKVYELYTYKFHGNSYIELLYGEICKWEIDTINYQDLIQED